MRAELATAEAQRMQSEQHAVAIERGAAIQRSTRVSAEGALLTAQARVPRTDEEPRLVPGYHPCYLVITHVTWLSP